MFSNHDAFVLSTITIYNVKFHLLKVLASFPLHICIRGNCVEDKGKKGHIEGNGARLTTVELK